MCLLIAKPAGVAVPSSYLHNAASNNPDGIGIAYVLPSSGAHAVTIAKSPVWDAKHAERVLASLTDHACLIHFRYATHGSTNRDNTHPFSLPQGWAAAHNGVIHGVDCEQDESDTRAFLRAKVAPYMSPTGWVLKTDRRREEAEAMLVAGGRIAASGAFRAPVNDPMLPSNPVLLKYVEDEIGTGNKFAFLSPAGEIVLANEEAGHWKDGIWYSNHGYLSSYGMGDPRTSRAYGGFKSRWSGWKHNAWGGLRDDYDADSCAGEEEEARYYAKLAADADAEDAGMESTKESLNKPRAYDLYDVSNYTLYCDICGEDMLSLGTSFVAPKANFICCTECAADKRTAEYYGFAPLDLAACT